LALIFAGAFLWFGQPLAPRPPAVRVSFVGDVLLARAVPAALARDSAALRRTTARLWAGGLVVANLECPLTDSARPVRKAFVFQARPTWAAWLRSLGVSYLALANNHTLDQHLSGLRATVRAARAAGLPTLGYQPDSLAGCQPQGLGPDSAVVVFNYVAFRQGIGGEDCLCGRDFGELCERLAAYKTLFPARAALVYLHWGTEYAARPSAEQRQQAHDLIDAGAAAVVGAHPHVVQPVEFYRGRPIVYSLGNFLFDQPGGASALAVQADFEVRAGRVVATSLRPLRLGPVLPVPADAPARTALRQRLLPPDGSARLVEPALDREGAWQAYPTAPAVAADSLPAYFVPHLTLGGTALRLRYLPLVRQYQVRADSGGAGGSQPALSLGFPLYRFTQGDVDGDGRPDLLVGPIKRTPLDPVVRRRLFVYGFDSAGRLVPRWRGSRLSYELVYFRAVRRGGQPLVETLEREPAGTYAVGQYRWQGFGLGLVGWRARHRSRAGAYRAFWGN